MANKKEQVVLRTITAGNGKGVYRAQLFTAGNEAREIVIEKQSEKDKKIETERTVVKQVPTLVIYPDYEGLNEADSKKRAEAVQKFLKDHSPTEALEEVDNEVIPGKKAKVPPGASAADKKKIEAANKKVQDVVISWQPRIQKELGFPIKTRKEIVPTEEIQIDISSSKEYTHKEVHSATIYYRMKPRDFVRYVHNFLNTL